MSGYGMDPVRVFGKDYAAEFKAKTDEQMAYNRGRMDALGITVPIGKVDKSPAVQADETVADEVRSDLGLTLTGAVNKDETPDETVEVKETAPVDGAGAVAKTDEVKEEVAVEGEVKAEETPAQPAHAEPITVNRLKNKLCLAKKAKL